MKFTSAFSLISAALIATSSALALENPSTDLQVRDTFESGMELLGHRSHEIKRRSTLHKHGRVTYYAGGQLDNPGCPEFSSMQPNDDSEICAVHPNSSAGKCGDWLHIHWKGKMSRCRIIDHCAGCGRFAIDVTKGVFKKLDDLSMGVLEGNGLHFRIMD